MRFACDSWVLAEYPRATGCFAAVGPSAERFRGAFLGCALGDAMGRPFEMMARSDGRLRPRLDAVLAAATPLVYSDDTQMMIAVAESLVRARRVSGDDILASLLENYDPARGYAHGMKRALLTRSAVGNDDRRSLPGPMARKAPVGLSVSLRSPARTTPTPTSTRSPRSLAASPTRIPSRAPLRSLAPARSQTR
jgi:hypothetical protein